MVFAVIKCVIKSVISVTMEKMKMDGAAASCPLCEQDSGLLDFGLACCTARYIARLKTLEQRRGWLDRIRQRKGAAFAAETGERLREIFSNREAGNEKTG